VPAVINITKSKLPLIKWDVFKNKALGKKYDLSVVICTSSLSKSLNKKYRAKNKPANILSFPLNKTSGEIFIDINVATKEAKERGVNLKEQLTFLYVHGLAHLAGFRHGSRMDKFESVIHRNK